MITLRCSTCRQSTFANYRGAEPDGIYDIGAPCQCGAPLTLEIEFPVHEPIHCAKCKTELHVNPEDILCDTCTAPTTPPSGAPTE